MAVIPKFVGERIKRREDPRLISGLATYVDDVRIPGMLTAVLLRSPHAHAKIIAIDVEAARRLPGVVCVLTGEDVKDKAGTLPCVAPAEHIPFHPMLARDTVRYVGEPVVVAVASDPYKAQDALDLVDIDYDPLDAVVDPERALEANAPILHEEFGNNLAVRVEVPNPAVDEAIRKADRVLRFRLVNQRLAPIPMEPRGVVAQWNAGSQHLTVWSSTQIPHLLRSVLAGMLKLGGLTSFIAKPVLRGFAFGLALTIILKQLASVVGVHLTDNNLIRFLPQLLEQLPRWNWAAAAVAGVALLLLWLCARVRRLPGGLLVVILGIAAGQWLDLQAHGVALIGVIDLRLEVAHLPVLP
ncbi:MAG: SulP family inorganic anion transporter, partial [Rhodanobacteraceae bacterium]